jgi:hypothetical protein
MVEPVGDELPDDKQDESSPKRRKSCENTEFGKRSGDDAADHYLYDKTKHCPIQ